jgi:hypothetical protein
MDCSCRCGLHCLGILGHGLVVVSGGAAWGCPLDWILEGDSVGADVLHLDGLGCGAHTCLSSVAGLVVYIGTLEMVEGAGGGCGMHIGA